MADSKVLSETCVGSTPAQGIGGGYLLLRADTYGPMTPRTQARGDAWPALTPVLAPRLTGLTSFCGLYLRFFDLLRKQIGISWKNQPGERA